ncbi:carbamoyl-phosphate synthase (glutamine-hydrolyzing) cpa2 [Elasticomyces elasticus]|nr:carbamoyl-phosphate synthase (glutamine-hydrolyzing) cpa2 [Elasticomyces elasticus]
MDVSTATTALQLLLLVIWACLNVPSYKNPLFTQFFFAESILAEIATVASLSFAPGLLEAVQSATPPSVHWFKSLPTNHSKRWAVYALVLEKRGSVTMIYIGSGTNSNSGVKGRWAELPQYVADALRDGYTIAHKGTLAWCPIPTAANIPRLRLLFLAMETAFAALFWAFKSRKVDHHLASCCPWTLSAFTYSGLCSHSPLMESAAGKFDLSSEQLEAIAAEINAKRSAKLKQYVKDHPDEMKANHKRSEKKIKSSRKFFCTMCTTSCKSQWELDRHNRSSRHMFRLSKLADGIKDKYFCDPCEYSCDKPAAFCNHKKSKKHLAAVSATATRSD